MKRGGRPRNGVQDSDATITQRVRSLINEAHDGNVHEASKVTGVPSATLRALFNGKSVNPGLKTLRALGEPYGFEPGWFSDESTIATHPRLGIPIKFREQGPDGSFHLMRDIAIPWSTWPLPGVFWQLKAYIIGQPEGSRPLIGKLDPDNPTELIELEAKVAKFLLAPLLKQEKAFGAHLIPTFSHEVMEPEAINRMRLLGQFWQAALGSLLESTPEKANA